MPTIYTSLLAKHKAFSPARRNREMLKVMTQIRPTATAVRAGALRMAASQPVEAAGPTVLAEVIAPSITGKPRVAIIGAGLAGLCAAYELAKADYEVEVFEARNRVGGRTKTIDTVVENKQMDGGAELIGDNHPLWLHYADLFGVGLTDAKDYGNSPIRIGDHTLSWEESEKLTRHLDKLIKKLTQAAEAIVDPFEPWMNPNAAAFDSVSLADWICQVKGKDDGKKALRKMMEADSGILAQNQSLLAVLAMVRGGGLDRFWTDTEVHRAKGGSQSLAKAFEKAILEAGVKLHLGTQVVGLAVNLEGVDVRFAELPAKVGEEDPDPITGVPAHPNSLHFEFVVLAIPPSVWKTILNIEPAPLSKLLNGERLQMGKNVKNLMAFKSRFWEDAALGPTLTEYGLVDMTWETTEADPANQPQFGLVAFSGADEAKTLSEMNDDQLDQTYQQCLGPVYRGFETALVKSRLINWPKDKWAEASYCFPAPGEVTKWGPIYKAGFMNRLHFAGEHTCYAYMGYMEGALSSGYRVAARIAVRDQLGIR